MQPFKTPSFREVLDREKFVRLAGAHDALGGVLAEHAGFDAIWSSSLEVSASRALPDASLLTMTEYLDAASNMQKKVRIPVVADCDTGYGSALNVAHMVHEYERAGITAVCMEDKLFPKLNSFAKGDQTLLPTSDFARKISTAKAAQFNADFFVVARTEALISGLSVAEALERTHAYADAGADAILIHSKSKDSGEVEEFIDLWSGRLPVVVVPTTYPNWNAQDMKRAGVSAVIYANQGLRSTVSALRSTFASVLKHGDTVALEDTIAPVNDVFELQQLDKWMALDA